MSSLLSKERKIIIASDHAGVDLKKKIVSEISDCSWEDLGPYDSKSVDYPDYSKKVCEKVLENPENLGVLICGTGIGMSISANKISGIRAALVTDLFSAEMTRLHNHSNVLCLAARTTPAHYACLLVKTWLTTLPSKEERHLRRIQKMSEIE